MLSEKQFRERTRVELRHIADQVLSLATDRDIYQKLEREAIARNPQLQETNALVDMVRGAYADAMVGRTLRLLQDDFSFPQLLNRIADYPQLLHDKVSEREFAGDRAALEQAAADLREVQQPHFSHRERTLAALDSTFRALNKALDAMISTMKTYYWVVAEEHLNLEVRHDSDPLDIFRSAWLK